MVRRAEYIHIHFAHLTAGAAGSTFVRIDPKPVKRYLIEQGVKGAQWADPLAERAIKENRQHHDSQQDAAFPGEQFPQAGTDGRVGNRQRNSALQNARRADVFAEKRVAQPHLVYNGHGKNDDKDCQDDIFQIGEKPQLSGAQLRRRNLVQQFLKPTEGTQKSAYDAAQQYPDQDQKSHDVVGEMKF